MAAHDLMGQPAVGSARFVIFASYGNDSVALMQWAFEEGLQGVVVVYSDTKWSAPWWPARVERMEWWAHARGFFTSRTTSIGFVELARKKKAFPTQQFQWCSYILKIEPAMRWLDEYDPEARAVCLVGVRREEGPDRAEFPRYLMKSGNHGGRPMVAPLADMSVEDRDSLLSRAGIAPLLHRSMECSPCVNSNRRDLRALDEPSIKRIEALETEMGMTRNGKPRTLFRPHRHMGAVGIREVVRWAHSERGKYAAEEASADRDTLVCNNGFCGV